MPWNTGWENGLASLSVGPNAPNLPGNAALPTPTGVLTGKVWDYGGMSFNVLAAGCKLDGVTDDTANARTAVVAAAAVNGIVDIPPGVLALKGQLNPTSGITIRGAIGGTIVRAIPTFADTTLLLITANNTAIEGIYFQTGTSATYSSNIAADCITIKGANNVWVDRCIGFYQNGWFINAIPNGTVNPFGLWFSYLYNASGKQGIHLQGQSVGAYSVSAELTAVFLNHMQAGDALFLDSVHDVITHGLFAVLDGGASAFNCIHINDNCAGIFNWAADCGGIAGGAYTGTSYNITHGGGTRANNVQFIGGITSQQGTGLSVDCDDFTCESHAFLQSQNDGVKIIGAGTNLTFINNRYLQSNLAAGTAYDSNCTNTTGRIKHFMDVFESTATTASLLSQLNVEVRNCHSAHATVFWANATPYHSDNTGLGLPTSVGPPGVPATTVAQLNNFQADLTFYVTAGAGSTTAVAINGVAMFTVPASGIASFNVPNGSSYTYTYTSAPSHKTTFTRQP